MKYRIWLVIAGVILLSSFAQSIADADRPDTLPRQIPFRPVNPEYARIKANINAEAHAPASGGKGGGGATVTWEGLRDTSVTPPDPNGAISPTQYVELVNEKIGVYNRSGVLLSSDTQAGFSGLAAIGGDATILWDTSQNRFFYSALYLPSGSNELAFGFSKGPSPSVSSADWCSYHSTFGVYGASFPDYPKIGNTADFILIGVNRFDSTGTAFNGADVVWLTKPAAGTLSACPALSTFKSGVVTNLLNADGTQADTPQPAHQTDPSSTGYVIANKDPGSSTSTVLSVYAVTKDPTTGNALLSAPKNVSVAAYQYPPDAPQMSTTALLDTLDARLMNAVSAVDPRFGSVALWTQHTVKAGTGGLGSEVRWYEINPSTGALFQSGVAHSISLYTFTGAISPDRLVNGATTAFGSNMVLAFNTSSTKTYVAIQKVSKIGANAQSGFTVVKQSSGANIDFSCSPCRWGDYAGASPDPGASPTGTAGQVWFSLQWNYKSTTAANVDWATWNFVSSP